MIRFDPQSAWEASGCAELTAPDVPAPAVLVARAIRTIQFLDRHGAGLADDFDGVGLGLLAQRASLAGFSRSPDGRVSCGGATRFLRTTDGEVALTLARPSDMELVPVLAAVIGASAPESDDPWEQAAAIASGQSALALTAGAAELGLPCASLGEITDRRRAHPVRFGDATPRPLTRALVVNLGSLWAAPLAAHILARLGAEVVAVESVERPDGSRSTPEFFRALRTGSRDLTLDFASSDGRAELAELLRAADVVIEGSRPRAMRQLGIDAEAVVADGPAVWLSIVAYGRAEPHAMRIGFGDDTAAAGGLIGRTRGGRAVFLADAIADPLTGLTAAATAVGLLARGGRWIADVALARVAAAHSRR